MSYADFLANRAQLSNAGGFEPDGLPDHLFDFQTHLVEWAVRQGRAAIFADCGLGKTPMSLAWSEQVLRRTGRPVLLLTPLAVGFQIISEAAKFGYADVALSRNGKPTAAITVTNYEQLEKFDWAQFGGVVCDESSAIKSFDGERRKLVTEFMRRIQYRLLGTATAAPNDYIELGTSSEALGDMGYMDMLGRFFVNDLRSVSSRGKGMNGAALQWRLKGHAAEPFWRWVSSWARAIRKPSDYGYSDERFYLPELVVRETKVDATRPADGTLFDVPAHGLAEEREENRRTLVERCEAAADRATEHDISIMWCNLNDEGNLLERLVPNSLQVSGEDSAELKEKAAQWFTGQLCICNEPAFRAKLATWHKGPRGTGRSTTLNTASNGSLNLASISAAIASSASNICASTTPPTPININEHQSSEPPSTPAGALGTPPTPNTASESNGKPRGAAPKLSETPDCSSNSGSPSTNTTDCSNSRMDVAQSAQQNSATFEDTGSLSITATQPDRFEDSSARTATKVSASSTTAPTSSTAPHCICGHISGVRRLISKSRIYGYGLNFQHCSHITYFPSHSYEQWYQAVRRCWRFGQQHPVTVDVITTEGGSRVLANLQRKADQADAMFTALVEHMNHARSVDANRYNKPMEVPAWVC